MDILKFSDCYFFCNTKLFLDNIANDNIYLELVEASRHITMYIKNKQDSSSIKACSLFELPCKQENYCFGIAYFSYTYRYGQVSKYA